MTLEKINSPETVKRMKRQMDCIVEHVKALTSEKLRVKEFSCYFKFRDNNQLCILYCSQLRIHSISFFDVGSPPILLYGNCRVLPLLI